VGWKARWAGEPEDNKETSLQDGDSSNSEKGLGKDVLGGVDPDILDRGTDSDDESVKNYTACSLEDCGYCGHCLY
jgi:hypothetical protein